MKTEKLYVEINSEPEDPYRITWGMVWNIILNMILMAEIVAIVGGVGILIIDKSVNG